MSHIAKWKRFSKEEIQKIVQESSSNAELCRKLGYECKGGSVTRVPLAIKQAYPDISFDHFTGQAWNRGHTSLSLLKDSSVDKSFVKRSSIYNALEQYKGHKCEKCGLKVWNNQPIPLEVHHIDGDNGNNNLDNLQLLCPNCHAQTENYRGKNIIQRKQKIEISDEEFIQALRDYPNIRQALIALDLAPKGGNYKRAYALCLKYPDLAKKYLSE